MDRAAEMFFEYFNLEPGNTGNHVHGVAEAFSSIPWENLTKFLLKNSGKESPRMAEEVISGHISRGTGGTCYSLTEALGTVMAACGVQSRPLTGHMKHGRNIHCALLVNGPGGNFILDPGYVVPGAVELSEQGSGELVLPGRRMLWKPVPGGWELHTEENGVETFRYALESRVLSRSEFMGYWKDSWAATGLESLHLNLAGSMGGRISAHNGNLRIVEDGRKTNLKMKSDYSRLVQENFGISPDVAEKAWLELERKRAERRNVTS